MPALCAELPFDVLVVLTLPVAAKVSKPTIVCVACDTGFITLEVNVDPATDSFTLNCPVAILAFVSSRTWEIVVAET